jgi:hypothetical protein
LVIVQLAGGVTAVQLKLVLELVVPEAANPVGALGAAVQFAALVVADAWFELPLMPYVFTACTT